MVSLEETAHAGRGCCTRLASRAALEGEGVAPGGDAPLPALAEPAWEVTGVALDCHLGEVAVLRQALRLAVPRGPRSVLPSRSRSDAPPVPDVAELPAGAQGALFRSYPVAARLPRLRVVNGLLRYVPAQYLRYLVDLRMGHDAYLARMSSKSRSTLRRKRKKLADHCGELNFRVYRTPDELRAFHPLARRLSSLTYQERLLHKGLPSSGAFVQQMLALARDDRVRAYLLLHGERPIAYLYCPVEDGVVLYDHLGYDPAYARWSAGTVLQALALQALLDEGDLSYLDFTEGEGEHKAFWATDEVPCADVYYLRPAPQVVTNVLLHALFAEVTRGSSRALDVLGLKRPFKKLLHGSRARGQLWQLARTLARRVAGDYAIYRVFSTTTGGTPVPVPPGITVRPFDGPWEVSVSPHASVARTAGYWGDGARGYGAWDGDVLVGACWFLWGKRHAQAEDWPLAADEAELAHVIVADPYRGRGIAPVLKQRGSQDMLSRGFRRIVSQVWHSNRAALAINRKTGWQNVALVVEVAPLGRRMRWVVPRERTYPREGRTAPRRRS